MYVHSKRRLETLRINCNVTLVFCPKISGKVWWVVWMNKHRTNHWLKVITLKSTKKNAYFALIRLSISSPPKSFLHAKPLWRARWFSPDVHEPLNFKRLRWCHGWQSCIWHGIERPVWYLDHIHSWWHHSGPLGHKLMPADDWQGHMKNYPMPTKCQIEEIVNIYS